MQQNRNIHLDFIRSISTLLIIFFHYNCATTRIISNDLSMFKQYGYAGNIGVSMFFILSGASLLLSTQNKFSLPTFYKKRFLSIFPLFWCAYILMVFINTTIFQVHQFTGRNPFTFILTILGMDGFLSYKIQNFYILGEWFLGCIIIFYIFFPIVRLFFYKNRHLLLVFSLLFCVNIDKYYNFDMHILQFPPSRLFEFVFGMYFITIFDNIQKKYKITLLVTSIVGIYVIFILKINTLFVSHASLGILFFLFLITLSSMAGSHLPAKIIHFLSKYSFAAFLLHHVILVKFVTYAKNSIFITNHNYLFFFFTVFIIYLFSFLLHSSLRNLFRNSLPIL